MGCIPRRRQKTPLDPHLVAKLRQNKIVKAAWRAKDANMVEQQCYARWKGAGGELIDRLLDTTQLIDAQYLISIGEVGGTILRAQEVPLVAKITTHTSWRLHCWPREDSLAVLVLSYPWLDAAHPDIDGEQLTSWLPILRAMVEFAKSEGAAYGTVGVMIDYMCLPQQPRTSQNEILRFEAGLRLINAWYAHPYTHVLLVTTMPTSGIMYGNMRSHSGRGWCYYERRASELVKHINCLWDLSRYAGGINYDQCRDQMKAERQAPMSPATLALEMRQRVSAGELRFTAAADLDTVINSYKKGFVKAFEDFATLANFGDGGSGRRWLHFSQLDWGDSNAELLIDALIYLKDHSNFTHGLLQISLCGNSFGQAQQAALEALQSQEALELIFDQSNNDGNAHHRPEEESERPACPERDGSALVPRSLTSQLQNLDSDPDLESTSRHRYGEPRPGMTASGSAGAHPDTDLANRHRLGEHPYTDLANRHRYGEPRPGMTTFGSAGAAQPSPSLPPPQAAVCDPPPAQAPPTPPPPAASHAPSPGSPRAPPRAVAHDPPPPSAPKPRPPRVTKDSLGGQRVLVVQRPARMQSSERRPFSGERDPRAGREDEHPRRHRSAASSDSQAPHAAPPHFVGRDDSIPVAVQGRSEVLTPQAQHHNTNIELSISPRGRHVWV